MLFFLSCIGFTPVSYKATAVEEQMSGDLPAKQVKPASVPFLSAPEKVTLAPSMQPFF
jgi:hypothetical protein